MVERYDRFRLDHRGHFRLLALDLSEMTGYEALRNGAAWLDVSARGKIKVMGEDRARLLHAMTTNHIQQLTPGSGCYAFFLTVQGRILSDVNVLCRPDHFLLRSEERRVGKECRSRWSPYH